MNVNELKHILTTLSHTVDAGFEEAYSINSGGCLVFANMVQKHLDSLGVKTYMRVYSDFRGPINAVRKAIRPPKEYSTPTSYHKAWNIEGLYFSHVVLTIPTEEGNLVYDSEGFRTDEYPLLEGSLLREEAEALSESTAWNSYFPRSSIPELEGIVNSYFKEVKKNVDSKKRHGTVPRRTPRNPIARFRTWGRRWVSKGYRVPFDRGPGT